MNTSEFSKAGHELIDWAAQYMANLHDRNPIPDLKPGFMKELVPADPPQKPEQFHNILNDLEEVVCRGMTHWQHPQFFAYFAAGNSWPSILGDILSNGTGANGSTWHSCPVVTELETIVLDWCVKFLGLPSFFQSSYSNPKSEGQGVFQSSASEAIFYSMVWARQDALKKLRKKYSDKPKAVLLNMMIGYCSKECHSSVKKAALMANIRLKQLPTDEIGVLRFKTLKEAIKQDIGNGLVPFYHCAIIGSSGVTCSDDLMEVGELCKKYDLWLHIDASYAGSSFALPELKHLKQGYEYAWSTNINTSKWMMCNFEATLHWVRYRNKAVEAFAGNLDKLSKYPNNLGPDLRHYGLACTRRLRIMKLWFVIRAYGVEGIRKYIRNHINLARLLEMYVRRDERFELVGDPFRYSLVSFRLRGYNVLTKQLCDIINATRKMHVTCCDFHGKTHIRFVVCHENASEHDIDQAWHTINCCATHLLHEEKKKDAEDGAMKYLYTLQHEHDENHNEIEKTDIQKAKHGKEDSEIIEIIRNLDQILKEDKIVKAAREYGDGDPDAYKKFDEFLKQNPDHLKKKEVYNVTIQSDLDESMLHFKQF